MRIFTALILVALCGPVCAAEVVNISWMQKAIEGESFVAAKAGPVRYKYNDVFVEQDFTAGATVACTNQTFLNAVQAKFPQLQGDLAYGFQKQCWIPDPAVPATVTTVADKKCGYLDKEALNPRRTLSPATEMDWLFAPTNTASFVLTWWCPGTYGPTGYSLFGFKSDVPDNLLTVVTKYTTSSPAEREALLKTLVKCPEGSDPNSAPCLPYKTLSVAAARQLEVSKPLSAIWKVKALTGSTSRPVYPWVSGKRGTTANTKERVAIGAACSCATLSAVEGTSTYCSVTGNENVLTAITTDKISPNMLSLCSQ